MTAHSRFILAALACAALLAGCAQSGGTAVPGNGPAGGNAAAAPAGATAGGSAAPVEKPVEPNGNRY